MRTSVQQRMDSSIAAAGKDNRSQSKPAGNEIILPGDFGLMPKIDPGAAKNFDHFLGKDGGVGVERAMHPMLLHQVIPPQGSKLHRALIPATRARITAKASAIARQP